MPEEPKPVYFKTRRQWRRWLEKNHEKAREIWLLYYKKHTGRARIPYDDAVEEALCFGWIDGKVRRRDEDTYMQRYTPRSDKSIWSEPNRKRVAKMTEQGQMTEAGLAKVRAAKRSGAWQQAVSLERPPRLPGDLKKALATVPEAQRNFTAFAPGYRMRFITWVTSAKKPETRERRIARVVAAAAANRKPGISGI